MSEHIRLTQHTKASGCAAKIGPNTLAEVLGGLPTFKDGSLLIGMETSDDAAVYRITDETAVIQTLDFFTPMVDDPYVFGQIAAANALSDVYAMGGEPKLALNIVCFPNCMPVSVLGEILKGGAEKVKEAGAVLAGGHSIHDDDPKYGLSVMGFVNTDRILANANAKAGDVLILTKQLGSGIVNTALKAEMADRDAGEEAIEVMRTLNKKACEVMKSFEVHACTDITGFGLLGHIREMASAADLTFRVHSSGVPLIKRAREYASMGLVPAGAYRNRDFCRDSVRFDAEIPEDLKDVLFDPQTSGGLLFSVAAKDAGAALVALREACTTSCAVIVEVCGRQDAAIIVD